MTVVSEFDEIALRQKFFDPQVKVTRRIEILESDGDTLWEGGGTDPRLISGSVSVDYSRDERRSLDAELANFDQALIHRPEGFWYDKVLRAFRGIEYRDLNGTHRYEVPVGKFMIDRVSQPRFPNTVRITARDYTKKALLSKFTETVAFSAGTEVVTIIAALAANSGLFDRILPNTTVTLETDIVFEAGTSRWEAMKQIATAFNYELFINAEGYLVMREFIDPTLGPISFEFNTGHRVGNLVDWEKVTNDTRTYNVVSVIGASPSGVPFRAVARNDSAASPTGTPRLGERVMDPFESSIITTSLQAQQLANSLLSVNGLEEYEIGLTSLVAPWLEAGEIIRFVDPEAAPNDPDRFLLTSLTIPLGLEAMTATGRRVTIVG